jgi:uncharacterized protein YbcV (DUF1398 family)
MFTLQQIKAAHGSVKTGADFPRYIKEIKQLGLIRYEFNVNDGSIIYYGSNDHQVKGEGIYASQTINSQASPEALRHTIAIHQQGQTDFLTFCRQAAAAGVGKWEIDTQKMLCTYYDLAGNNMVAEPIPEDNYA